MLSITTFPTTAYPIYAERFLKQWQENAKKPLTVFYEEPVSFKSQYISYRPLAEVEGHRDFQQKTAHIRPKQYLFDVRRFSHKAFAQLAAFELVPDEVWWFDADLVFKAPIPEEVFRDALDGVAVCHMGRKGSHTESGIVGFNLKHPDFAEFKRRYSAMYRKREILFLPAWTDCHALDYSLKGLAARNLTPEGKGVDDVIGQSPFGPYLDHLKGRKKLEPISTAA